MLGSVLLETVGVALIFPLVRILVDPDWVIKFPPLSYAYHLLGFDEPRHFLAACALGFLAVIIFKSAYNAVLIAYQERLCHQISSRVGSRLLARYFRDPWKDHLQRNSADMISVADVMSGWPLTNALRAYPVLVTESLVSVVLLVMLLLVAAQPALVSIAIFGIALLLSHNLVRRRADGTEWRKCPAGLGTNSAPPGELGEHQGDKNARVRGPIHRCIRVCAAARCLDSDATVGLAEYPARFGGTDGGRSDDCRNPGDQHQSADRSVRDGRGARTVCRRGAYG